MLESQHYPFVTSFETIIVKHDDRDAVVRITGHYDCIKFLRAINRKGKGVPGRYEKHGLTVSAIHKTAGEVDASCILAISDQIKECTIGSSENVYVVWFDEDNVRHRAFTKMLPPTTVYEAMQALAKHNLPEGYGVENGQVILLPDELLRRLTD